MKRPPFMGWMNNPPDDSTIAPPGENLKKNGYEYNSPVTAENLNWIFQNISKWQKFFPGPNLIVNGKWEDALKDIPLVNDSPIWVFVESISENNIVIKRSNLRIQFSHRFFKESITTEDTPFIQVNGEKVRIEGGFIKVSSVNHYAIKGNSPCVTGAISNGLIESIIPDANYHASEDGGGWF